jgi:hypothetical protein
MGYRAEVSRGQDKLAERSCRMLKKFVSKAAGSSATEVYPLGYVARRRATENAAGGPFQHPVKFWLCHCPDADAASRARHGQVHGLGCSVAWSWASAYEDK